MTTLMLAIIVLLLATVVVLSLRVTKRRTPPAPPAPYAPHPDARAAALLEALQRTEQALQLATRRNDLLANDLAAVKVKASKRAAKAEEKRAYAAELAKRRRDDTTPGQRARSW